MIAKTRFGSLAGALLLAYTSLAGAQSAQASPTGASERSAEDGTTAEEMSEADQRKANARMLANEASAAYRKGDYATAYDKFNRAFRLVEVPMLGLWSARALVELGRLVEASERYREVVQLDLPADAAPTFRQGQTTAQTELEALLPRIPTLTLVLENARTEDVRVEIDGKPVDEALVGVQQRIDPGEHVIVAQRGSERLEKDVYLKEASAAQVELLFKQPYVPASSESPADSRASGGMTPLQTTGLVTAGVGGAFLVGGIATLVVSLGQQSDLEEGCPGGRCPPELHDDVDSFETMKTLSLVGFIGGGVLAATGATLYVVGSPRKEEPGVAIFVDGHSAGLKGRF